MAQQQFRWKTEEAGRSERADLEPAEVVWLEAHVAGRKMLDDLWAIGLAVGHFETLSWEFLSMPRNPLEKAPAHAAHQLVEKFDLVAAGLLCKGAGTGAAEWEGYNIYRWNYYKLMVVELKDLVQAERADQDHSKLEQRYWCNSLWGDCNKFKPVSLPGSPWRYYR